MSYKYGDFLYPKCIIDDLPDEVSSKPRTWETPGIDGQGTSGGLIAAKRFALSGLLNAEANDDLDQMWADFKAAHRPGQPKKFYDENADGSLSSWFIWAEVESARDVDAKDYIGSKPFNVPFLASDPFLYSDTLHTFNLNATGGTVAVGGSEYALPILTLVLSAVGAPPSGATYPTTASRVTITNTTTGAPPTILYARSSGTVAIDSTAERVFHTGASNVARSRLIGGPYLRLAPGVNNTLTIAVAGGAAITAQPTIAFRDRRL